MKRKSDYAIVVTCNPQYDFGLISCMNAQNYFKTDADWEIAYTEFTNEQRQKISDSFPFNVNWTPLSDLTPAVVSRRSDPTALIGEDPVLKFWLGYWLLAHKLLREKKYKAVCVTQADQFTFVNLDVFFKIAESGILVCSEYPGCQKNAEELPFGNDKGILVFNNCCLFDSINFLGQQYTQLPMDIVHYQEEDYIEGTNSSHSVVALNRAVSKHGEKDKILRLDRNLWVCDWSWTNTKFYQIGDKIMNDRGVQVNSWHTRCWQKCWAYATAWRATREGIISNKGDENYVKNYVVAQDLVESNFNLVKNFMEIFNKMIPEISSTNYEPGTLKRPRYELGEDFGTPPYNW